MQFAIVSRLLLACLPFALPILGSSGSVSTLRGRAATTGLRSAGISHMRVTPYDPDQRTRVKAESCRRDEDALCSGLVSRDAPAAHQRWRRTVSRLKACASAGRPDPDIPAAKQQIHRLDPE
jgi:hypothetical protein